MNTYEIVRTLYYAIPVIAALLVGVLCFIGAAQKQESVRKPVHMTQEEVDWTLILEEMRKEMR